jgi:alkanesulfonate monooxygenase SsuD/methylene tetrahydromethanopterin reductase-like flavin-dependent oxidoreductase (luciferase family)
MMDIGIGLPSTIPGVSGEQITTWARVAEEAGFSTLGTIDRIAYGNVESVVALAAAAAVTDRIRLTSAILIAPYRTNHALLAKQLASIDVVSNGRFTAGLAVGGRRDDYDLSDAPFERRGKVFEAQLERLHEIWDGRGPVGPRPVQAGGPPLLIGGTSDAAYRRAARFGAGWIAGGGGPQMFASAAEQARAAWRDAGREGRPRLVALSYFSLGSRARENADAYLRDYYGFLGDIADMIAAGALTDAAAIRETVDAYAAAGCDELILFPSSTDPDQVDELATAVAR